MRYYGFQNEVKSYLNRLERENEFRISAVSAKVLNDRVESLKKSGIWAQYGLGFNDVDGDAYLTRANVTDLIGRSEVLWFIRGMKALGLYSNMVVWPMRSYQNAGTGSTVYSLGGLGIYNGMLTNSPTWGVDGVSNFVYNVSNVVVPPISVRSGGFSILTMHRTPNNNNARIWDGAVGSGVGAGLWCNYNNIGYFDTKKTDNTLNRLVGNFGVVTNSSHYLESIATTTGSRIQRNGTTTLSDSVNLNNVVTFTSFRFGLYITTNPTLTIPFGAILDIPNLPTSTYNLYKNTLGNGLGLT